MILTFILSQIHIFYNIFTTPNKPGDLWQCGVLWGEGKRNAVIDAKNKVPISLHFCLHTRESSFHKVPTVVFV